MLVVPYNIMMIFYRRVQLLALNSLVAYSNAIHLFRPPAHMYVESLLKCGCDFLQDY